MGCSTSRPGPLHVRRRGLRAAMFLTAPVLSLIVLQSSKKLTKWSIMAFCSIRQAYHPPLLVWFYKPLFKTLCLIGWRGETPLLPKSSCEPKVSKRSIFADLLNNIHFRCSAATYRTKRTFSLLHLHSSVQPPTPGQSVRKLSGLPTGLPSKV